MDVFEDMQLQIEHTTDMHSEVPVLFIDASVAIDSGFALQRLAPEPDHSVTTHAVSPAALLSLYSTTMRKPAPAAYQLHVAGRSFELGESPGDDCRSSIDAAWRFLQELLERPADTWADTLASASVFNGELSVA